MFLNHGNVHIIRIKGLLLFPLESFYFLHTMKISSAAMCFSNGGANCFYTMKLHLSSPEPMVVIYLFIYLG